MASKLKVAVVMPTFNRAAILPSAIESILRQEPLCGAFEFVVVDNNSADGTREIVQSYARNGANVRYLCETHPGPSSARNGGIVNTRADILAFIDDDVQAENDWIGKIIDGFDKHPEVLFIGGRVLPNWGEEPPQWLTKRHWGPLALVDYGDDPFYVDREHQVCLVAANLAVRRSAFDRFGLFSEQFLRCEDHELQARIIAAGGHGMYLPELLVKANVQSERLRKSYHRKWHSERSKWLARMSFSEAAKKDTQLQRSQSDTLTFFAVPASTFRELLENAWQWCKAAGRPDSGDRFEHEAMVRYCLGFIRESYRLSKSPVGARTLWEAMIFVGKIVKKKLMNVRNMSGSSTRPDADLDRAEEENEPARL